MKVELTDSNGESFRAERYEDGWVIVLENSKGEFSFSPATDELCAFCAAILGAAKEDSQ